MPSPRFLTDRCSQVLEILTVTRFKVVDADDVLFEAQQRFNQMRTDESCAARHQPTQGFRSQLGNGGPQGDRLARRDVHHSLHTFTPRERSAAASTWPFTST